MSAIDTSFAAIPTSMDGLTAPSGLTGDSLMAWLATKLGSIDGDVNALMKRQTDALKKKDALQHYASALRKMQDACKRGKDGQQDWDNATNEFTAYVNSLPEGSPESAEGQRLLQDYNQFLSTNNTDGGGVSFNDKNAEITSAELEAKVTEVEDEIGSVDKDSDLVMIQLNQLMSQRQTAVQLAQNIMNSQNKTLEGIVQKMA